MSGIREKLARVLAPYMATFPLEPDLSDADDMWDARTPTEDSAALRAADAVLDALMEPTEGMVAAGLPAYELIGIAGGIVNTAEDHVGLIFEAMIAAAKEDGQ